MMMTNCTLTHCATVLIFLSGTILARMLMLSDESETTKSSFLRHIVDPTSTFEIREGVGKVFLPTEQVSSPFSSIAANRGSDGKQNYPTMRHRSLQEPRVPKLVGDWERIPDYPVDPWVGEAQGMLVGTDLVVAGGFSDGVKSGTTRTAALDLSNPGAQWREMAEMPFYFWTHGGHATKGDNLMYVCGGYFAAHPGDEIDDCYVFDKSDGGGGSWTMLPNLPEGRGGGALLYIESLDSLVFTLGATRGPIIDEDTTWLLDLKDISSGWSYVGPAPYQGNHVSGITAYDCKGDPHYYILGGQKKEDERDQNIELMYEFIPSGGGSWVQMASMLEPKGHFTTAMAEYGCGFITVGGAINGGKSTDDVVYYDIDDNKWTKIGKYPETRKTQVCAAYNDVLTCSTGYTSRGFKVDLSFPTSIAPVTTTVLQKAFNVNNGGFKYQDNIFRGAIQGQDFATGWRKANGGIKTSGGLKMILGGGNDEEILEMSGGFVRAFSLTKASDVTIQFFYKIIFPKRYYTGEFSEVLFSLDGTLYGLGGFDYIEKVEGVDGFNDEYTPKWTKVILNIPGVSAGSHDIAIGGHNNKKMHRFAKTTVEFDNVKVTATA